jgi:Tol biopolymer transport system component
MSLAPGVRLGPYEIVSLLGAGGMGEVYKARDSRLDRSIAVKVLPAALAADPEFRERFEREAKSISALNHPNICTLHDVGRLRVSDASASAAASADKSASQGPELDFLVMEYLEGETLASRLTRGAMPLADALKIAGEIASALEKAHRHGIVHRDLKPGNVMLTKTGAKLLDFGLAKTSPAVALGSLTTMPAAPAEKAPLTARGTVLGTFQYMAPEQVEGEAADARTDIFAFGALLFELVTGRRAFEGKSQASLIGAILKDQPPPISQLVPLSPPALDQIVRACLAKDRDDRIQTAHDLLLQLRWIAEGSGAGEAVRLAAPRGKWVERAAWAIALAAVSIVALMLARRGAQGPAAPEPITFAVETGGSIDSAPAAAVPLSVSPDGRWLAMARPAQAERSTNPIVWLRRLGSVESTFLPGSEQPGSIFWSPDSRAVVFRGDNRLKRVDVPNGTATTLCPLPGALNGGTWSAGGTIIFSSDRSLYRLRASGGEPVVLLRPDQTISGLFYPAFLPDGRHVVFFGAGVHPEGTGLYLADVDATAVTPTYLTKADSAAMYSESGYLLFTRDGALLAQPFDAGSRRTTGDPLVVATSFASSGPTGYARFAIGANVLAYRPGAVADTELAWFDRTGTARGVVGEPGRLGGVRISPDGGTVAFGRIDPRTGLFDTWTNELATGISSRLTTEPTGAGDRFWSPDGRSVAYFSRRKGNTNLYYQTVGARDPELIYESPEEGKYPDDWFDNSLLFHRSSQLFVLTMQGERKPRLLLESPPLVDEAQVTVDGRFVAYGSNSSGRWEVYVAPMATPDLRRQVSAGGGGQAHWRGDGKELFYLTLDGAVMSVAMKSEGEAGRAPEFGAPVRLFQSPNRQPSMTSDEYDVTRDGKKFLFVKWRGPAPEQFVTVSVNWTALLKK